jgi:hypothetical protein
MKYTYKELKGLPEGIQTKLINEAGQKLNKLADSDFDVTALPELDSTRIMSMTLAFKGLQIAFQGIDDYTDYILAGVHEGALERSSELKTELEDMADIINTDLSNAYLRLVPYVMTDKEIQAVIDKSKAKKKLNDEILANLLDAIKDITGKDAEVKEVGEDEDERVITEDSIEKVLDKAIEESKQQIRDKTKDLNILDILNILFPSK